MLSKYIDRFRHTRLLTKVILGILVLGISWYIHGLIVKNQAKQPQYQTAQVTRGTLVSSVTASGSITSGNNLSITTSATGTVSHVYYHNGDKVKQGQKIADITLDQDGLQKQSSAWASYLSAKNSLDSAKNKLNSLQASEFSANQKFINDAVMRGLSVDDPTYIQENAAWLQAEGDYKNQYNAISQSQASLTSAWYSYQQVSPNIVSPASGIVSNLMIALGTVISAGSSNSGNSTSSQQLGTIKQLGENTQAAVTLSEIDATMVNPGQKVTITMDAFPDKTFTGKVIIVNTNGQVSSGVTSYPATIQFDTTSGNIYPNMGVNAKIITAVKDDVLIVPSQTIQTTNGQKTIRLLQNNKLTSVPVETGIAGDSETEIISGVTEGETVVTSIINPTTSTTTRSSTASPFGSFGGGTRGGNATFISR